MRRARDQLALLLCCALCVAPLGVPRPNLSAAPAPSFPFLPEEEEENKESAKHEVRLDLALHAHRPAKRHVRAGLAQTHRRGNHSRPQFPLISPAPFRAAANSPLHC